MPIAPDGVKMLCWKRQKLNEKDGLRRMDALLRADAEDIVREAIRAVLPEQAVRAALRGRTFPGRVFLLAVGKAAFSMARAAYGCLQGQISAGIVITKYGHAQGALPGCVCYEAGHPVPDEAGVAATKAALQLTSDLLPTDTVLFLVSGGGSALFEQPAIPLAELADITQQLLRSGADIREMNTVRKRLSLVKGGRFAAHCAPARVLSVALSDVLGDAPDLIASGPAAQDCSTCEEAAAVVQKYHLSLPEKARAALSCETPRSVDNAEILVTGSVRALCAAAAKEAEALGYAPLLLTDALDMEARDAGAMMAEKALSFSAGDADVALIAGGETIVHVTGTGLGGRNTELALAASLALDGKRDVAVCSVGSDGTDGPTDAAGGYVDGDTAGEIRAGGRDPAQMLADNDAYHALALCGGLIMTGPTGTNVNDLSIALIRRKNG